MKYPNFIEEKKLWKKGYKCVVGLDEAGRGPLAGPVVAAAVIFNFQFSIFNKFSIKQFSKIKDSKQLSPKKREELYNIITTHPQIEWGIGVVSGKVIDKINILEATKLAMQKAVIALEKNGFQKNISCHFSYDRRKNDTIYFLLVDGNFGIRIAQSPALQSITRKRPSEYKYIPFKSIIKGDQKVFSISAASIIAKVTRDRIMQKYHKKYPEYGFENHKGYPTKAHFANLKKFGPCKIHRKSFRPISVDIKLLNY